MAWRVLTDTPSPSDKIISISGTVGQAVTAILPPVAGLNHYITQIEFTKYATANINGSATPIIVTSTNLPGALAWTFDTAQSVGSIAFPKLWMLTAPIKSVTPGIITSIIAPAVANIIWRINVLYYVS